MGFLSGIVFRRNNQWPEVFVEQMFSGVRLILSLDGIGLDVEAKLDQAWATTRDSELVSV